jgi:hypothetical protein
MILLLPGGLGIAIIMKVTAHIIAPTTPDPVPYALKIGWSVGVFSMLYGVIWGLWLFPRFKNYVLTELIPVSNKNHDKEASQQSDGGDGT